MKKKKKAVSKHEDEKVVKRQKTDGGLKLNTTARVDILHMKVRADKAVLFDFPSTLCSKDLLWFFFVGFFLLSQKL